jgi:DNA-binding MarR family transcriptional regulator
LPSPVKEESDLAISVVLTHLYRDLSRAFSQNAGMSLSRFLLLHELLHAKELSQSKLHEMTGIEEALLTRFVKEMEVTGLIFRRTDPKDNRYTLVSLTPAGRHQLRKMKALREKFEGQLLERVSEKDRITVLRALKTIQDNIERELAKT